jgi:hypothetical protein
MSSSGLDGGVKMCNFNKTLLHEYIDGELAPLEVQILEEHLKSCSECRKELNQLKILDWDLHHQDAIEVPYEQLAQLRKSTFDDCCREYWESQETSNLVEVYKIQTSSMLMAVNYMHYLPGARLIKNAGSSTRNYVGKRLNWRQLIGPKR